MSRQILPFGSICEGIEGGCELHAAARHVRVRLLGRDRRPPPAPHPDALRTHGPVHGHEAGRDRLLRPGAAGEEAALDENHVGALAGHRSLESITVHDLSMGWNQGPP